MNNQSDPSNPARRNHIIFCLVLAATILYGVVSAFQKRWVCDDAFISYRYALNLVEGHGLVYNAGERVEGYSNFLWTLWCVVPIVLGIRCETWTMMSGIACYAGTLTLLGDTSRRLGKKLGATQILPIAAILCAAHADMAVFATSGLETSLFTMLATAGFWLFVCGETTGRHRPIMAGFVITLAALTRPDGVIFGAALGAGYLFFARPRWRMALSFAAAFAIPHTVFVAWRVWYYGDLFPNTYYAKSGNLAWWSQGWAYFLLYLQKYWAVSACVLGLAAIVVPHRGNTKSADRLIPQIALVATAMAAIYTLYIVRVGGDFMFARMLIPATPFYLLLIELGLMHWIPSQNWGRAAAAVAILIALILPDYPMKRLEFVSGVVNEHSFYGTFLTDESQDRRSAVLKKYFSDLPVRIAFLGAEAHVMYRAKIATAIESEAGLTDRFVAHQPISDRGRVGHEKNAPLNYLIRTRKTHFTFHSSAVEVLRMTEQMLPVSIVLDGMPGFVLTWDPAMIATVRQRGGQVEDLPSKIDGWIMQLDKASDAEVADLYGKLKLMYFEHVPDPLRETPFRKRLKLPAS